MNLKKDTVSALCQVSGRCGGCRYKNSVYASTLRVKQSTLIRLLGRFGKVEKIVGATHPVHYRNKAQHIFGYIRRSAVSGIYQADGKGIVACDECLLEDPVSDSIIKTVRELCPRFDIRPYDIKSEKGYLRHVLVRIGRATGEIMVVLVTAEGVFSSSRSFVNELLRRHDNITTVVHNINDTKTPLFLGEKNTVLYGNGYITDELCGLKFRISPRSFYQINPEQTQILYGKVAELASLTGEERVIDAYCGTGTIGLSLASKAKEVVGVEKNPDAVRDAEENASLNGVTNARFVCADAGDFMRDMAERGEHADVVITDPPRAGCSKRFLESLVSLLPARIVYVSCNPETLARDLGYLTKNGYNVDKIQGVDMFPFTEHVETVVCLSRKKVNDRINFDINIEALPDRVSKTATYAEIKAYVLEHYGFKVSSLYIAQIKDKHGIKERENYNIGEGKSKELICPPEKEEAITNALKHFNMI